MGQPHTENQPGAEGNLVSYNNESFNIRLDAHYENVLLKIAANKDATIDNYSVMLNTPYSKNVLITNNDLTEKASADYDWIRFGKPASTTTFKAYKESETTDIFTFLDELIKSGSLTSGGDHFIYNEGYIYTTAYVNEYYYGRKMELASDKSAELQKFINADDRTMRISFGEIKISEDKQSSYIDNIVFSIQQCSIKSFFDLTVDNPYGIEQVEETAKTKKLGNSDNDNHYGYSNFKNAIETNSASWSTYVNTNSFGYILSNNAITFNSNALTRTGSYGIYQCLSRNRDENGDGTIDGDEIKWYLPAVDQCTYYWFGMNSLPSEARIQMKTNEGNLNNYWNSTSGDNSTWWADEGSSYGMAAENTDQSVRCIRSLKNYSGETSTVSKYNSDTRIVTIIGLDNKSVRESNTMATEYSEHFRGETPDKLPEAFQIANDFLSADVSSGVPQNTFTKTEVMTGDWCQNYYSENGKADRGQWRIPNEKELALINLYTKDTKNHSDLLTAARSKYTRPSDDVMVFYVNIYNQITTNLKYNSLTEKDKEIGDNAVFKLRCVRDATPDSSSDETDNSSNTFESGGNVIK